MNLLLRYLLAALATSVLAGALLEALAPALGLRPALQLVLAGIAALGLVVTHRRARRAGLATPGTTLFGLAWLALGLGTVSVVPAVHATLAAVTALLFTARALWWHRRPAILLADALFATASVGAFLWVLATAASAWLALWAWALAQGLVLLLPPPGCGTSGAGPAVGPTENRDARYAAARRRTLRALARLREEP